MQKYLLIICLSCFVFLSGCSKGIPKGKMLNQTVADTEVVEIPTTIESEDIGTEFNTELNTEVVWTELDLQSEISEELLAYWLVMNSKKAFISTEEDNQKFFWDEYHFQLSDPEAKHRADEFVIVDMDQDGSMELVLYCSPELTQVFHYEDGEVYSYQFVFRGMKAILVNGIYDGSSGAFIGDLSRIVEFNKDQYTEETLAYMNNDYFEVEGVEVSSDEFFEYTQELLKTEMAAEYEFTDTMLDRYLLAGLSENERMLLHAASAEPIEEEKQDFSMDQEIMNTYRSVLLGEQTFDSVSDEGKEFNLLEYNLRNGEVDEYFEILYFSIVDMDADGTEEILLTCYYDTTMLLTYIDGRVYGYQFSYKDMGPVAKDGTFFWYHYGYEEKGYGRVLSFDETECKTELIETMEYHTDNRVRYYPYTTEVVNNILY